MVALAAAVAVSLGASQGAVAQMPPAPGSTQFKGPGIQGKMNSTSKAERIAAAIRNSDRRASQLRANHGKKK
jgi:hypothetical protein